MNSAQTSRTGLGDLLWPALIGATLAIPVELVGTLYLGELLLLGVLIDTLVRSQGSMRKWPRFMRPLVLAVLLLIIGYAASDLVAGTSSRDMLRGNARVAFLLIDFCGMAALVGRSGVRLQAVVVGYSLTAIAIALIFVGQETFFFRWKIYIGYPLSVAVTALLTNIKLFRTVGAPIGLIGLGILHVSLDSRSLGALCVIVAAILIANQVRVSRWRMLAWPATAAALVFAGFLIAASLSKTTSEFSQRRTDSDTWRLAAVQVTAGEIISSPLIGHGSWASGADLIDAVNGRQRENGYQSRETMGTFQAHSMLLQAWFEGGILGLLFPVLYGITVLGGIAAVWKSERHFKNPQPLLLLLLLNGFWHLLFSPFNGSHRIDVGLAVGACIVAAEWLETTVARRRMLNREISSQSDAGQFVLRGKPAFVSIPHP